MHAHRLLVAAVALGACLALVAPGAVEARTTIRTVRSLETELVAEINTARARHGLVQLRVSSELAAGAREHSRAMGLRGFFQHDSLNGSPFWRRLERHYSPTGYAYWGVGENLLWNVRLLSADEMVRKWLASPRHRHVLLYPSWREVGVSAVRAIQAPGLLFANRDVTIVTSDFGARRAYGRR